MKLLFLGTGAADFSKELRADTRFGLDNKSVRRSSSMLLDDEMLFDCGLHVFDSINIFGVALSKISCLFVTHFHGDHFKAEVLKQIAENRKTPLPVYYNESADFPEIENVDPRPLKMGERVEVSLKDGSAFITALPANHDKSPCHFLVEKDGKKLFYALDGAWLTYDEYYAIKDKELDCIVMDCTVGDYDGDFRIAEHNSLPMIRTMKKSLLTVHAIKEDTEFILSHIAVTLHEPHEKLCENAAKDGFKIAYDGMVAEV